MGRIGKIVAAAVTFLILGAGAYVVALQLSTSPAVDLGPAIKIEDGVVPATPTPSPTPETTPSSSPKPTEPTEPTKSSTRPTPKKSDVLPSKSAPVKPLPPSNADDDDDDDDWDDDRDDDDD